MIGIDTNVLLRHTLDDDAVQSPQVIAFLENDARGIEPALISPVVLLAFVWTLLRRERFRKEEGLALLDVLVSSPHVILTDRLAVTDAFEGRRAGRAGFQDDLIGSLNRVAGARTTLTFDSEAARHADVSPMPA
ncbi:PIN domain-containing protein [Methylobacterium isbiliense]|uniref:PIN domain-containing protein n=1 Tax=Methylobacterium isbiliense TaxID=315478 RepID=A0ABQ4SD78_9HYPH|nr:hypothetical protein [Methylobacterium isbiliense]MDN3623812.1 hypothetical protein [Methylobacterium isbiliense]GJE01125.1 hypothetical protein GMJLKIPL_3054 [Methylobacterium isbiliense]